MTQPTKTYPARPRWLKVFSDIWQNRSRTILVVASIAIGVFAVGMIISAYTIMADDMESSYRATNPANVELRLSPFDDDLVQAIEKLPEVATAEGRHTTNLRISHDEGKTWRGLEVIAFDQSETAEIYLLDPLEGQSFPNDREVLLEVRILDELDIGLGDSLLIRLPDGKLREVPVTGFVYDQSIIAGPGAAAVAYINFDTLGWLGQTTTFNQLLVTVEGDSTDEAHIAEVAERVEMRVEESGQQVLNTTLNRANEHPSAETVLAVLSVLGVMGALMLVLGGSLIANTLTALLNQQMRQIGVMKLVGAQNRQIIAMYLLLIISLGLISLIVSVPLAAYAGYGVATFFGELLSITVGEFRFVPAAIVTQFLIAIFVPILAGVMPVISGARRTVEAAISDGGGAEAGGVRWLNRLGESFSWVSRPVLISLRNTFRNMRRLSLTLLTLTIAGGIFIAVFNVQSSLISFIGNVSNLFIADLTIELERPYREEQLALLVEDVPGVVETEAWLSALGEVTLADEEELSLLLQAPPADSELVAPDITAGRFLQPGDENALVVAETILSVMPDIAVGDTLALSVNGGREQTWVIVGIYSFPARAADSVLAYVPYETIAFETNLVGRTTALKVVTEEHTPAAQKRYANLIDNQLRQAGIQVTDIEPGTTISENVSEGINTIISLLLGMALLTAVVGSIGLAGTMSMNVMERIREIGILRAIGAVDTAVTSSVLIEGMFIGFLSWVLGALLSFPASYALVTLVSLALTNSVMPLIFTFTGFWVWLVVVLILSALASVIPARNASRLTIREVLAYE